MKKPSNWQELFLNGKCFFKTMRTQNKENYYYVFWVVAMIAFIAPQVMTAIAYHKLAEILSKPIQVELVSPLKFRL